MNRLESLGYKSKSAFEYEFFLFNETPESIRQKEYRNLNNFTPGMFGYSILRSSVHSDLYHQLLDMCTSMDMALEGLHTETGPGVLEAAIMVDEALISADKASLFKTFTKVMALRNNLMANFMAKWSELYPGQSGHIHISLLDTDELVKINKDLGIGKKVLSGDDFIIPEAEETKSVASPLGKEIIFVADDEEEMVSSNL